MQRGNGNLPQNITKVNCNENGREKTAVVFMHDVCLITALPAA